MQDNPPSSPNPEQPATEEPSPAVATGQAGRVETLPSLEELLRESELKAAEHHDAWLRAKAETENLRRRAQEDLARAHKYAAEKFAAEMLPVKDSLEAALATENATAENLRNGVELTLKQLVAAFEKSGLAEINPTGEKFDPHRHQAISTLEDDGEPNRVLNVLQKGYALSDRVIRPALVIVSKARGA
ncbi:MAG: nucleotide exchange factor GrpE [Rhodocyclales bacterium]|nr:nucleotide exchange factor GrpE [Rhodocyclales bacterium]